MSEEVVVFLSSTECFVHVPWSSHNRWFQARNGVPIGGGVNLMRVHNVNFMVHI